MLDDIYIPGYGLRACSKGYLLLEGLATDPALMRFFRASDAEVNNRRQDVLLERKALYEAVTQYG